jgi:hypothetical protein
LMIVWSCSFINLEFLRSRPARWPDPGTSRVDLGFPTSR